MAAHDHPITIQMRHLFHRCALYILGKRTSRMCTLQRGNWTVNDHALTSNNKDLPYAISRLAIIFYQYLRNGLKSLKWVLSSPSETALKKRERGPSERKWLTRCRHRKRVRAVTPPFSIHCTHSGRIFSFFFYCILFAKFGEGNSNSWWE